MSIDNFLRAGNSKRLPNQTTLQVSFLSTFIAINWLLWCSLNKCYTCGNNDSHDNGLWIIVVIFTCFIILFVFDRSNTKFQIFCIVFNQGGWKAGVPIVIKNSKSCQFSVNIQKNSTCTLLSLMLKMGFLIWQNINNISLAFWSNSISYLVKKTSTGENNQYQKICLFSINQSCIWGKCGKICFWYAIFDTFPMTSDKWNWDIMIFNYSSLLS